MSSIPGSVRTAEAAADAAVPNFNRLASLYRWMEYASFGPWLWWCRCAFLPQLKNCRRALVVGDGDGRFTARLLALNSTVQVDAVDGSASMLHALVRRAGSNAGRISIQCIDARRWQPGPLPYDLVVTHFFLDCLTTPEVRNLAAKLQGSVTPTALWVVSEFAAPQSWFGRLVGRPIVSTLYAAFGLLTGLKVRFLPDHAAAMRAAGFVLAQQRPWLGGLLVSQLWCATPEKDPRC
jgi:SAM-dependent methyltransferase